MWHQWSLNTLNFPQNQPAETEEYDQFMSFKKSSRKVYRQQESASQLPALRQYDDAYWHKILQNPSEESFCDPSDVFPAAPAELVCGHTGSSCLENLPSPAKLMRKKKKKSGGAAERRVAAVTRHITELRRKQSFIDELKGEKWGGSSVGLRSEWRCVCAEGEEDTFLQDDHHHEHHHPQHTDSPISWENWCSGSNQLLDLASGGNPMISFVAGGTAHREAQMDWEPPGVSHSEFWGFSYNFEE